MDEHTFLLEVQALLSTTATRWINLAETLTEDLLSRPPKEGEWSARQCLQHLLDTEQMLFPVRLRAFVTGQDFPGFDPSQQSRDYSGKTTAQLAEEFTEQRSSNLKLLEEITPKDLPNTARHQELGQVTLEQMLNQWVAHDLNHTLQAERALAQPFIAGSGPWRFYFKDHDMGE